jgi:nitrate/nitrite transporter NarK
VFVFFVVVVVLVTLRRRFGASFGDGAVFVIVMLVAVGVVMRVIVGGRVDIAGGRFVGFACFVASVFFCLLGFSSRSGGRLDGRDRGGGFGDLCC